MSDYVTIIIDGREVKARRDSTVLTAALDAGIHIPHLCHDPRIKAEGSCGLCVVELVGEERYEQACETPVYDGMVVSTDNPRLEAFRRIRLGQHLDKHYGDCVAPCVETCPSHIDIQAYLYHTAHRNFDLALRIIKEDNPLPVICGHVCPHPCEYQCRRNLVDDPVAINGVKRFLADRDLFHSESPYIPEKAPPSGKKVAIIGSGPSGLAAAYYLTIKGHKVTIYEKNSKPGGMLRYGIPAYRLPKQTLDAEIDHIVNMGVDIQYNKALGVHFKLDDLVKKYDAVYLAIGAWNATPLRVDGANSKGVWLGIEYLRTVAENAPIDHGKHVVVVGGGNTAIDCARTALRKGAERVMLVYRRTREEMPAEPQEISAALEEGVEMRFLASPSRIERDSEGHVTGVWCMKMRLGEPDASGRRRPVPIDGEDFFIPADMVIGALGQSTDTSYLRDDLPIELNKWGDIKVNGRTMETSVPGVFAGGDCVTGAATAIQAIAAGKQAASSIDQYLHEGRVIPAREDYSCSRGSLEDLPRHEFEKVPRLERLKMPEEPVNERIQDFREVELGFTEEEAVQEASRCLQCGCAERYDCHLRNVATQYEIKHKPPMMEPVIIPRPYDHPVIIRDPNKCILCGMCVRVCEELEGPGVLGFSLYHGRITVGAKGGVRLRDSDCVSCGQCVSTCPSGALVYRRDSNKVWDAINSPDKVTVAFVAPAVRTVIADYYGVPLEQAMPFIAGLLKRIGIDRVFDLSFAADLTVVEESAEFLNRFMAGERLPQFTSCCPAWVTLVEKRHPDMIPNLSTCRSPQQMMGSMLRNHYVRKLGLDDPSKLFVVSVVPCTAKKNEADRPEFMTEGIRDVNAVITTEELIEMAQWLHISTADVKPEELDEPYRIVTGGGILFGSSGGVAEAALRVAAQELLGEDIVVEYQQVRAFTGIKEAEVDLGGRKVRIAVASGLKNAEVLIDQVREGTCQYDLIEIMACPGGCINGGGHPQPRTISELKRRQEILHYLDAHAQLRMPKSNPDIKKLYDEFLGGVGSSRAHELLHTSYHARRTDGGSSRPRPDVEVGISVRAIPDPEQAAHLFQEIYSVLKDKDVLDRVHISTQPYGEDVKVRINGRPAPEELLDSPRRLVEEMILPLL